MSRPIPDAILKSLDRLDPLPITVHNVLRILSDPRTSIARIADVIEHDQAIAASVLRLSRTMAYGGCATISTVREAVLRLGTATLLDMVLGEYLRRVSVAAPMYRLTEDDLWLHGAASQLAVKAIVAERPGCDVPLMATTAALVHDIGKLLMVRHLKVDVSVILRHCATYQVTFVEAERALFGTDHAAVGAAMARSWQFPAPITRAIEEHHDAEISDPTPIIDAVVTANFVTKTIGVGLGAEGLNLRVDPACLERLGLDFEAFGRVCVQTSVWLDEVKRAHGVGAPARAAATGR